MPAPRTTLQILEDLLTAAHEAVEVWNSNPDSSDKVHDAMLELHHAVKAAHEASDL